jgi:hypothetical protein
MENIFEFLY